MVTDAMDAWPARTKWSLDFFRFPDDEIVASSPAFLESGLGLDPVEVRMRLADCIDYVRDPRHPPQGEYLHRRPTTGVRATDPGLELSRQVCDTDDLVHPRGSPVSTIIKPGAPRGPARVPRKGYAAVAKTPDAKGAAKR